MISFVLVTLKFDSTVILCEEGERINEITSYYLQHEERGTHMDDHHFLLLWFL